jgi:[ribosomal protein S18]-alanine N-acetyltransferase
MSLLLRYMRLQDIPDVMAIEHRSFTPPWTARSYAYEVNQSTYSHMVVLERSDALEPQGSLLHRLWARMTQQPIHTTQLLAYGGLWFIGGEGHISTIASHPDMRRSGFGELVFASMIHRGITLGAHYMVLEVRVSNHSAQALYHKYGFTINGVKPDYYQHNHEDAYDMRRPLADDPAYVRRFQQQYRELLAAHGVTDAYSDVQPPPR